MPKKSKVSIKQAAITMLLLGFSLGYLISHIYTTNKEEPITEISHTHIPHDASEYELLPSIDISVTKDSKLGFNLHIETENFTFTPRNASTSHIDGQGHAHLYIDDIKITRLYSTEYYLGELEPGEHTIKVGLSTNDHKDYFNLDEEIADTVILSETGTVLNSSDD